VLPGRGEVSTGKFFTKVGVCRSGTTRCSNNSSISFLGNQQGCTSSPTRSAWADQLGAVHRRSDLFTQRRRDRIEQADLSAFTADVILAAVGESKCCGAEDIAGHRLV
jgi:hypothetical protein